METRFNFQINPQSNRKAWEEVPVISNFFTDRVSAIQTARKAAQLFKAEVRMTEGNNPLKKSGAYFNHLD